jgi:polar amino acid transport system ATP-binding protein
LKDLAGHDPIPARPTPAGRQKEVSQFPRWDGSQATPSERAWHGSSLDLPLSGRGLKDALRITSVDKHIDTRQLLHGVTLRLRQREVLALCGPSGCGKSTLLRIICGLTDFDAGELTIGEETVSAHTTYPAKLYGKIGLIFQDHNLFPHMTAIANVTLGLREVKRLPRREARERAIAELERMGVASLAERFPSTLSGGERQRVAIARALAMDPLLLLLDEPTAHLDSDRVFEVRDRVLELARVGTTMVLVTHNIQFAREAARTYALLRDGLCIVSNDSAILD